MADDALAVDRTHGSSMTDLGLLGGSYGLTGTDSTLILTVDAKGMTKLRRSEIMRAGAMGDASTRQMTHIYYDTDDRRLARRGLSLSVFKSGERFVQTVTARATDDPASANELWDTEVSGLEPQPQAVTNLKVRERFGFIAPGALEAVFTIDVEREQRLIELHEAGQSSLIAVCFDSGEIKAGSAKSMVSEPFAEIELELIKGARAALFRFALDLLKIAPMALQPRRRAERGYALSGSMPPPWVKAKSVRLEKSMTTEDAMCCIFAGCLTQIAVNQPAAWDGRDPEGVHQLRVAVRRLRSAFTTFGPLLAGAMLDRLKEDARWVIRSLNPARDWDVFLTELLPPVVPAEGDASFETLVEGAQAARAAGYDQARSMLRADRFARFMLEFRLWLIEKGWRHEAPADATARLEAPITEYASLLLAKRHKSAMKRGKGFDEQTAEKRHELRIALKKLRYLAEFFESLFPSEDTKGYLQSLKSMQDDLGHLNDVATAERLVAELIDQSKPDARIDTAFAAGRLIGWYAHGTQSSETSARSDWKALKKAETFW